MTLGVDFYVDKLLIGKQCSDCPVVETLGCDSGKFVVNRGSRIQELTESLNWKSTSYKG